MRQKRLMTYLFSFVFCAISIHAEVSLNSWNDLEVKKRIVDFVSDVTNPDSKNFVQPADRIAVFDNDGTLWAEQPMYFQLFFAIDRVKELAPKYPEWKDKEPFASVLKGDIKSALKGGEKAIFELVMATHSGMSTEEFESLVLKWIETKKHPQTKRLLTDMIYLPMLEILQFLRKNGFKTYIVSGGGIEFMRPWTNRVYGIPPEQVIGSSLKTKYEVKDGKPAIIRLPEIGFLDDKTGKPLAINKHIGKRPVMAFGNSDGDFQMLEWTTAKKGPSLGVLIHHTDSEREFAYDRKSHIGKLDQGLDEAAKRNWVIVDMKKDWKDIFKK